MQAFLVAHGQERRAAAAISKAERARMSRAARREKLEILHNDYARARVELEYTCLELMEAAGLLDFAWTRPQAETAALNAAIQSLIDR